jgi:predicted dehydrogenase
MESSKQSFKIGLIGCGRISQSYFEAIQQIRDISLTAVADLRHEAADALAEQSNATPFYDIESYLEKSKTQATIVCTPPHYHKSVSCQLLEGGQHVLCEKPLAKSLEEGIVMMDLAKKKNKHLMMASKFRYVDDVIRTKGIISSGLLGQLVYYENCFSGIVNMSERWNSNPELSGGGVLVDNGTHSVDIVRYLMGPIQSVRAIDLSTQPSSQVEDTALLSFITTKGIQGVINLSWKISIDRNAYIGIYGSDGRLRLNWNEASYQYNTNPQWIPFGYGYNKIDAFRKQVLNFVGTIQGSADPLIKEKECLASVAVIEASYRSLKSGKWENVDKEYN